MRMKLTAAALLITGLVGAVSIGAGQPVDPSVMMAADVTTPAVGLVDWEKLTGMGMLGGLLMLVLSKTLPSLASEAKDATVEAARVQKEGLDRLTAEFIKIVDGHQKIVDEMRRINDAQLALLTRWHEDGKHG